MEENPGENSNPFNPAGFTLFACMSYITKKERRRYRPYLRQTAMRRVLRRLGVRASAQGRLLLAPGLGHAPAA